MYETRINLSSVSGQHRRCPLGLHNPHSNIGEIKIRSNIIINLYFKGSCCCDSSSPPLVLSSLLSASSQKGRGEMIQQYVSDQNIIKRVEYWDLCSYNCTTIKKRQRPLLYVSYKSKSCFMGPLFIKLLKSYVNCSNKISNRIKAEKAEKVEETTLHLEKTLARNQFVVQVEQ